ncbi:TIGR03936 family radical SAM-associated protein [Actinocrinis puniceicyclus]|uniref:TIGR03936 family radical SAM-associated protein n=1 Tax=Actinocrinis puniceicyclus TaxID=977794 RepID=UPI0028A72F10|nr:TIGR03936 family radical SAM-associated protein [Actinocrinis puniceicyclus]
MAQRLRIRYAKRGRLRFTSHRDIQRAFERALRRAAVPMAYSAGFSPHPKISWAGAAPTGTASEAEYVEIAVTRRVDPSALRAALDAALPPDLDVLEIVEAATPSLAEHLEASLWRIELPGVEPAEAQRAADVFLAAPTVQVERLMKTGLRSFDARSAVVSLDVLGAPAEAGPQPRSSACAILRVVVRHATPAVRPDDVLTGLGSVSGLVPPVTPRVTRLAQGPLVHGDGLHSAGLTKQATPGAPANAESAAGSGAWPVADPMALDRSASAKSGSSSINTPVSGV